MRSHVTSRDVYMLSNFLVHGDGALHKILHKIYGASLSALGVDQSLLYRHDHFLFILICDINLFN